MELSISVKYYLPGDDEQSTVLIQILKDNFFPCESVEALATIEVELDLPVNPRDNCPVIYFVQCDDQTAGKLQSARWGAKVIQVSHDEDELLEAYADNPESIPKGSKKLRLGTRTRKEIEKDLVSILKEDLLRHHVRVLRRHFIRTWENQVDNGIKYQLDSDPLEIEERTTKAKALEEFRKQTLDGFEELERLIGTPRPQDHLHTVHIPTAFENASKIIQWKKEFHPAPQSSESSENDPEVPNEGTDTANADPLALAFVNANDTFLDFTFLHLLSSILTSGTWEGDREKPTAIFNFEGQFKNSFQFQNFLKVDPTRAFLNTRAEEEFGRSHAVLLQMCQNLFAGMTTKRTDQASDQEKTDVAPNPEGKSANGFSLILRAEYKLDGPSL